MDSANFAFWHSRKSISKILHSLTPLPLESPALDTPHSLLHALRFYSSLQSRGLSSSVWLPRGSISRFPGCLPPCTPQGSVPARIPRHRGL
jgi:hypothetical protein